MSSREAVLAALGAKPGLKAEERGNGASAPGFLKIDDWDAFAAALESAGGRFIAVQDQEEARSALAGLLEELGATAAVAWKHPLLESLGLADVLEKAGVELLGGAGPDFIDSAARADLGMTSADALLAESGSLVLASGEGRERSGSLLPPVHLAVVGPGLMLADAAGLPALARSLADDTGRLPSALHVISGPSSTADIEQTLVLGIHGPITLVVLAIKNP